ncbi:AAA family ATPase [Pasteurella multocida]
MGNFKIKSVLISGFWGEYECDSTFNNDINIIIGQNGSGKTTFMNILHGVLSIDIDELSNNDFDFVKIILENNKKKVEINIKREDDLKNIPVISYSVEGKTYRVSLPNGELGFINRRRILDDYEVLRNKLNEYISLYSLSVYRNKYNYDYERERDRGRLLKLGIMSSVDFYLNELLIELGRHQLELAQKSREISENLQREVLLSLLYTKDSKDKSIKPNISLNKELENLKKAYQRFGFYDEGVNRRIDEHVKIVSDELKRINDIKKEFKLTNDIIFPSPIIEAKKVTDKIIDLSSKAEKENDQIFSNNLLFLNIIKEFTDKVFEFRRGELKFIQNEKEISLFKLSSGEKQLLILLIETLLQRESECIFLADEPEISLHIKWQRNIIKSIISLNPKAQIIVATHSPEIAGMHKDKIKRMSEIKRN